MLLVRKEYVFIEIIIIGERAEQVLMLVIVIISYKYAEIRMSRAQVSYGIIDKSIWKQEISRNLSALRERESV
jgi:hypothetical protein